MLSCLFQPVTLLDDGAAEDLSHAPDADLAMEEADRAYQEALQEEEQKTKQAEAALSFKGALNQLGTDLRAGSPRYDEHGNPVGLTEDDSAA
eukprot:SAG31_NODE_5484_length_2513_cov_1.936620_1_plen_92_part_00